MYSQEGHDLNHKDKKNESKPAIRIKISGATRRKKRVQIYSSSSISTVHKRLV